MFFLPDFFVISQKLVRRSVQCDRKIVCRFCWPRSGDEFGRACATFFSWFHPTRDSAEVGWLKRVGLGCSCDDANSRVFFPQVDSNLHPTTCPVRRSGRRQERETSPSLVALNLDRFDCSKVRLMTQPISAIVTAR